MDGIYGTLAYIKRENGMNLKLEPRQLIMVEERLYPVTFSRVLVAPLIDVVCKETKPDATIQVGILAFDAMPQKKILGAVLADSSKKIAHVREHYKFQHPENPERSLYVLDMHCAIPAKSARVQFGYISPSEEGWFVWGNNKEQLLEGIIPFYNGNPQLFYSHAQKILESPMFNSRLMLPVRKLEEKLPQGIESLRDFCQA